MKKFTNICCFLISLAFFNKPRAQDIIITQSQKNAMAIAASSGVTQVYVDKNDDWLVIKAATLLQADIEKVTGKKPDIVHDLPSASAVIIIGSIERSAVIQQLAASRKIDISKIKGKWETYLVQSVSKPVEGINAALIIAGSDKRGTAYGVMDLCRQLGVSPWYWWADVPVEKKAAVYVKPNILKTDGPLVKYRGIFINDEAPALSNWSKEKFGGFNHLFYEKVFELMLRLKSNYIWPAMWGNAFYDDDSLNRRTADNYGIVIGTSHHEPLLRAHDEWRRYGKGRWNYDSNETKLKEFWKGGVQRAANTETIISVGMRGDGDMPMTQGTAIALLERIVRDQRAIIQEVTGKPPAETPQLWALYKEVQDYYDKGMQVPDDVTLLLCDDNWGNIRRLPKPSDSTRKGGYGIYYHFDYVGGPRNYKWINTNNISRVWEQMHLAWEYNARQIWIVNVGDIKPMEQPISFFLDYAWNPTRINAEDIPEWHAKWAEEQFGKKFAKDIAILLRKYGQYASRRKPELLSPETYSYNEGEWENVVEFDLSELRSTAEVINELLPAEYKEAYFQLVLHPVKALENLHRMYYMAAHNRYYHSQKNIIANNYADSVTKYYILDSLITEEYHHLGGGRWNHMMSQTHIGYTYWQQPPVNKMPDVRIVHADSAVRPGVMLNGEVRTSQSWVPKDQKRNLFYQRDHYSAMEAANYTRAVNTPGVQWKVIPDIGRTGDGITIFPVTAPAQQPGSANGARLEYEIYLWNRGNVIVQAYFSPTLNFHNSSTGLRYAISIDDEAPQIMEVNKNDANVKTWEKWVADNIIISTSQHRITNSGKHIVKFWAIDPGLVLQKLVLDFSVPAASYLGKEETKAN